MTIKRKRKGRAPPAGAWLEDTAGEPTWRGAETQEQVQTGSVIEIRQQAHAQMIRRRCLIGLGLLLIEVLALGLGAMTGVACHWFSDTFALQILGLTLTPSFGAWLLVLRWAFTGAGQG